MQHDRLVHLEKLIAGNQGSFHEVGKALKEIRDQRLYKAIFFETFAAYTKARWDMGKSQAYRLINSYVVVKNLKMSPIGDILPANEFQVRPLIQLTPLKQRKVWKDFVNTGMEITAYNIQKFINNSNKPEKNNPVDFTNQISEEYMDAVNAMLEQVRIAQNNNWIQTSRQAGLLWNSVIQEKILSKVSKHG